MRYSIGSLTLVAILAAIAGCSTQRMQLSKADPPKNLPQPEERVKYGFPWSKPKEDPKLASTEIPQEIKDQLAKSKTSTPRTGATKDILSRAADAESRGDLDAARAAYLQVVEVDAKNVEAHHRLGVISDMRQDPQSADQHYMQAYAINRRDADLLCDMGYSLYLRGRLEDSERRLKEALEVNAYHRAALSNLGLVYGKQGRYDDALAMFRKAGTESEAQRNIAQLFPNGKPGGRTDGVLVAENRTVPFPMVNAANSTAAPPMPADIDRRLTSLATDPVQPGSPLPQPQGQTLAQLGTLQPSLPASPNGPNASPYAPPAMVSQPAVAAKPQGSGNPWTGNLEQPLSANDYAAIAAPPQPAMMAPNPNFPPPGFSASNPAVPSANMAAFPPLEAVSPANFQPDLSSLGVVPAGGVSNPAEASRIAAQIAMGAGPGSMMPFANAAPSNLSPYGTMPGTSPPPNAMAFEYGNAAPAPNLSNLNIPSTWANDRTLAAPVEAMPTQAPSSRWGQPDSLAPASPWSNSSSPAGDSSNWRLPPDNSPGMSPMNTNGGAYAPPPAFSNRGAPQPANPNTAQPPQWPGNPNAAAWPTATAPAASSMPGNNSGAANWPVIQPGAPTTAPAMNPPATGGTSTVPNWPYSPSRPN